MIERRLASGRWARRHPGVYVLGGVPGSWSQDLWVAALAVGRPAVVSHETALLAQGAVGPDRVPRYPLVLIAPHGSHHRVPGAIVHQIDDVAPQHRLDVDGLEVTAVARTVVDLAATSGERWLAGLLDQLVVESKTTDAQVAVCLNDVARLGKPGVAMLGRLLDERGPGHVPPESELEQRLFDALRRAGLPSPVRQIQLPGRGLVEGRADAGYPDVKMLLEADGGRWHNRIRDLHRDHTRDAEAARAGWVTLRFRYEHLVFDPDEVAATVADVRRVRLAQLTGQAA
jgi:very-short-patch-repair endonuclease